MRLSASDTLYRRHLLRRIRALLIFFVFALVVSGFTAIPLQRELEAVSRWLPESSNLSPWVHRVRDALTDTNSKYPFLAYGTDWLAFGHFVIAIAFFGPILNPVRNVWVVEFGMIACVLILPFAFGMGAIRGIPMAWRLIDCLFGVFGIVPLWICRKHIAVLSRLEER